MNSKMQIIKKGDAATKFHEDGDDKLISFLMGLKFCK